MTEEKNKLEYHEIECSRAYLQSLKKNNGVKGKRKNLEHSLTIEARKEHIFKPRSYRFATQNPQGGE